MHQFAYMEKVPKQFYIDKLFPLSTSMLVSSLDIKDPFKPEEDNKELFGLEAQYLNPI